MPLRQEKHLTKSKSNKRLYGPVATVFASTNTGSWRIETPVVEFSKCTKCGTCAKFCPLNIIDMHRDQEDAIEINWDYCKGCGICANVCPAKCITMLEERSDV